jgi:hypothetical protein
LAKRNLAQARAQRDRGCGRADAAARTDRAGRRNGAAIRALVAEIRAVGRAEGADLPDDLPDLILAHMRQEARDGINSIHADRRAGRAMEIDARNGVIVRAGVRAAARGPGVRNEPAVIDRSPQAPTKR